MPQDKFITRRDAGIGYTRSGYVTTPSERAARRISDNEVRQAMFDMADTDRDIRRATAQNASSRKLRAERQVGNQSGTSRLVGSAKEGLGQVDWRKALDLKPSRSAMDNEYRAAAADVTARDAANARIMRERLAARKSAASRQPKGGGALANPMLGVAATIAEADRATGYKRTRYSGNFGGPSFSVNPYSSKSSYAGQSPMSKMMGVGKKSK